MSSLHSCVQFFVQLSQCTLIPIIKLGILLYDHIKSIFKLKIDWLLTDSFFKMTLNCQLETCIGQDKLHMALQKPARTHFPRLLLTGEAQKPTFFSKIEWASEHSRPIHKPNCSHARKQRWLLHEFAVLSSELLMTENNSKPLVPTLLRPAWLPFSSPWQRWTYCHLLFK